MLVVVELVVALEVLVVVEVAVAGSVPFHPVPPKCPPSNDYFIQKRNSA
jgi:hypothetical protein